MKRLVEMETGLCNTLGEKAVLFHTAKDVPSEEDLESFRKRIKHLEDKRVWSQCTVRVHDSNM